MFLLHSHPLPFPLPIMLTVELRMALKIWIRSPIYFKDMSFWYPFFKPQLTTYHSAHKKCVPSKKCSFKAQLWYAPVDTTNHMYQIGTYFGQMYELNEGLTSVSVPKGD